METPYVVLMGDVGHGKSRIVEKACGVTNLSSNASETFTRESKLFYSADGRLIVADTPGSNAMKDKLSHNCEIAIALNYADVSRIFIVVKAETRIDNGVGAVRKYAEQLVDLDMDALAVIVTHMDQVTWDEEEFRSCLDEELGMNTVVFSGFGTDGTKLQRDILNVCKKKFKLSINGENFFKLFKISNNNIKILRSGNKQVELFRAIKQQFDEARKAFPAEKQADLAFEFQAFMLEQIDVAQKTMARENNFEFYGEKAVFETGHIANMSNQLRAILYDIRVETMAQAPADHGVAVLKKCPHCGQIWDKIVGCEGTTYCGERPVNVPEYRNNGVMATFAFQLRTDEQLSSFKISEAGSKKVNLPSQNVEENRFGIGCGRKIEWKGMNSVPVPPELRDGDINTNDVDVVPKEGASVKNRVSNMIQQGKNRLGFGN